VTGKCIVQPSTFLIAAVCVCALLAGCVEGDSVKLESTSVPTSTSQRPNAPGPTTTTPTTTPPSFAPEPTTTDAPSKPKQPLINVTVDAPNGSIPFEPTFTIRDSAFGGGHYNWTVDFGEGNSTNGTDLPGAARHVYRDMGEYTVNVTLRNEAGESKTSLNVTALDFAAERYSGEWATGAAACGVGTVNEWPLGDANETTHVEFPVNNTTWGLRFSVAFDAPDADQWMVDFFDEDNVLVGSFEEDENATVNGTVPTDAALVVLWACEVPGGGSAEYVSATASEFRRQDEAREAADEDDQ
jgi:hypothetical protein